MLVDSVFDVAHQHASVDRKLVAALERVGQAFRVLLWDKAKVHGLSPIQIQCLIYIRYHSSEWARVGHLAQAFDMTPATISDAISILVAKGLLIKTRSPQDGRVFVLSLTPEGIRLTAELDDWATPLLPILDRFSEIEKGTALHVLLTLIEALQSRQTLSVARLCTTCRFFERNAHPDTASPHYCHLLNQALSPASLRLDCPEHEPR